MSQTRPRLLLGVASTFTFAALGCGGGFGDRGAGGSGGAVSTKSGSVGVQQLPQDSNTAASYVVGAHFSASPASNCMRTPAGACTMYACQGSGVDASAGDITVASPHAVATLLPDGSYYNYSVLEQMGEIWQAAGETISVTASGAEVPAFMLSILSPPSLSGTVPAGIHVSEDLTLTWDGQSTQKVVVELQAKAAVLEIKCTFDASAGSGTIPKSLMSQLPKGAGHVVMASASLATIDDDGWDVEFGAYSLFDAGQVTLQ